MWLRQKMVEDKLNVNSAEESKQLTDEKVKTRRTLKDFNKKELVIYSDDWFEYMLLRYTNSSLPNTRKYLIDELRKNPNFKTERKVLLKQDLIDEYKKSRINNNKEIFNYDFSNVPELILGGKTEKFEIIVNEINPKTEKIIGSWKTTFEKLMRNDNPVLGYRKLSSMYSLKEDEFLKRAKEIHGDLYDYSEIDYQGYYKKVKIYCKTCKKYFWQTPASHVGSRKSGCPICGRRKASISESWGKDKFIEESKARFGENKLDYSKVNYVNSNTKVLLYCNDCKKWFWQTPASHLRTKFCCPECHRKIKNLDDFIREARIVHGNLYDYSKANYQNLGEKILIVDTETGEEFWQKSVAHLGGCGNPSRTDSIGEQLVKTWLLNTKSITDWKKEFMVSGIEGRIIDRVYIDFYVEFNKNVYFIEYNGQQHYNICYNQWNKNKSKEEVEKDFLNQLKRDNSVRNYCKEENITLIEIPYTYRTYKSVSEILDKIIIKGETDLSFIKIPDIEIPLITDSDNEEGQKDEQQ